MKVDLRLKEDEITFLEKVAKDNSLYKANNEPSLAKSLRFILQEYMSNNSGKNDYRQAILSMIEQINIAIPHLYYNARLASSYAYSALKSNPKISDEELNIFVKNTIDDTVKSCGQIQNNEYETLYTSHDHNNIKTIPIDKDKNQWK